MYQPVRIGSSEVVQPEIAVFELLAEGAAFDKAPRGRGDVFVEKGEFPPPVKAARQFEVFEKRKVRKTAEVFEELLAHKESPVAEA